MIDLPDEISPADLVLECEADGELFARTFFPRTVRQASAPFHRDVWDLLDDSAHRRVAIKMFRGSGKTTLLRLMCAKRIAYGISRTILFVSASQSHALRSVIWLKKQVELRGPYAETFHLSMGSKWTEEWIEVVHGALNCSINIVAAGLSGQVRGLNIEDYRPDLIIVDDVNDEENTASEVQREKTEDRVLGALENSLAPNSECPDAKICILQTPFVQGDLIDQACKDPRWASREYSCFDEDGESRWPVRFPTSELVESKEAHMRQGKLHVWMREWECKTVGSAGRDFELDRLQYWTRLDPEARFPTFMYIDPVPPPSATEEAHGYFRKNWEVLAVVGLVSGNYYVLEIARNRGHDPDWTLAEFFRLVARWRPVRVRTDGTAYQRTLQWILERAMRERRLWVAVEAVTDKRKKRHRILQGLGGLLHARRLFAQTGHHALIEQISNYPTVDFDDDIEAVACACELAREYDTFEEDESLDPTLIPAQDVGFQKVIEGWRSAP